MKLEEEKMSGMNRIKYLRIALVFVGALCIFGIYPLMLVWPAGFAWPTVHSDYALMIVGIYATLGVFLLLAARDPLANLSLIWFAVWSSVVHACIMAVQALANPMNHMHLLGDVLALLLVAALLAYLTPRSGREKASH
jgi:hypothetical protein